MQHTIAYELVRRKQQEISGDQEWMYQLPEGEGDTDDVQRREIEPLVTKALLLVADGRAGEAALLLVEKKVINLNRKTDEATHRSEQGQRSAAYAAEVMYSDDDGEDPDYTPITTIRLDPIAKAVALANPGNEAEEKAKPLPVNNALLERLAKFCHEKTSLLRGGANADSSKVSLRKQIARSSAGMLLLVGMIPTAKYF